MVQKDSDPKSQDARTQRKMRLAILAFGCACLAFLSLVDHAKWFELRPASGTATAMSYAAQLDTRATQPAPR